MTQGLKALSVLPKDMGFIPRTHMAAQDCVELQFQGAYCSLLVSVDTRHAYGTQIYMQATYPYTSSIF